MCMWILLWRDRALCEVGRGDVPLHMEGGCFCEILYPSLYKLDKIALHFFKCGYKIFMHDNFNGIKLSGKIMYLIYLRHPPPPYSGMEPPYVHTVHMHSGRRTKMSFIRRLTSLTVVFHKSILPIRCLRFQSHCNMSVYVIADVTITLRLHYLTLLSITANPTGTIADLHYYQRYVAIV